MLVMDWLREAHCHIGFGTGALFIGRKQIPLVKGNGASWCRRVVVAEEVVISPRSQCDVPSKTLYGSLGVTAPAWMTEASELSPGVHVARVLLRDQTNMGQVRVINLSEQPVRLCRDQMIGELHPVQVNEEEEIEKSEVENEPENPIADGLMKDLPEVVPPEARESLRRLLVEYKDVFSASEGDLRKTMVCEHKIDTGDARPVRQPFRRQPIPYRDAIDRQLEQMLTAGVVEPALSEWAANVVLAKKK